jgi:hypothetical protein
VQGVRLLSARASGRRTRILSALGLVLGLGASVALAQGFRSRLPGLRSSIAAEKTPYDGRFTFARLRHGQDFGREPPWAHDYPRAERNFTRILQEITLVTPNIDKSTVVTQDDADLFASPIVYVSEPGFWTMTGDELSNLQEYVKKGGFLIFDDFRGEHWYNFEEGVRRLIPNARLMEIDVNHTVFHSFFDIDIKATRGYYGPASFQGVFEDNDPTKRLLLVANYNHDLGELWEFSDTGFVPVDLSNDAYKYGVNYIIYAMTH